MRLYGFDRPPAAASSPQPDNRSDGRDPEIVAEGKMRPPLHPQTPAGTAARFAAELWLIAKTIVAGAACALFFHAAKNSNGNLRAIVTLGGGSALDY